jgi:hypothetical protein
MPFGDGGPKLHFHPQFPHTETKPLLGTLVANLFKSRRRLEFEHLFLRHQLNIALRRGPQRLRLRGE